MTPGELALREAARLEASRIYGRLCPDRPQTPAAPVDVAVDKPKAQRLRAVS